MLCHKGNADNGRSKISSLKKGIRRCPNITTQKNLDQLEEGNYDLTEDDWDMV